MTNFLRNAWYVAAWEEELAGDALLARTLLGVRRVLYRLADGMGFALLADQCPHRFAPLHLGKRKGDAIACPYHGLEFGPDGRCRHNPFSDQVPERAQVESLPVIARHGLVWFWPGDPARADSTTIPDFSFLEGQKVFRRHSHFNGNYELLSDNLMDLSHVDFLHEKTFNTNRTFNESSHEVRDGDDHSIWSIWLIPRVRKFPIFEAHFPGDTPIDQLTEMRWHPPASMMLRISWRPAGGSAADTRFSIVNPHIITPESGSSSHYFWTCEADAGAEAFARAVFDGEDKPMIEAVQANMGEQDFWEMQPVILKGDVAAVRVRRRLARLRSEERGAATT